MFTLEVFQFVPFVPQVDQFAQTDQSHHAHGQPLAHHVQIAHHVPPVHGDHFTTVVVQPNVFDHQTRSIAHHQPPHHPPQPQPHHQPHHPASPTLPSHHLPHLPPLPQFVADQLQFIVPDHAKVLAYNIIFHHFKDTHIVHQPPQPHHLAAAHVWSAQSFP